MLAAVLSVILALLFLTFFWGIILYKRLVKSRELVKEGWSDVGVQLKRRHNLIPNLTIIVKQHSINEKGVLEDIAKIHSFSIDAKTIEKKSEAEAKLFKILKTLFLVVENYPNLKSNERFLALKKELYEIEQDIQFTKRYYNDLVKNYNIFVESFPSNIVASSVGFVKESYFELI